MDIPVPSLASRRACALAAALAMLASLTVVTASASARPSSPAPLDAAREVLALSNARLELMDEVMASKWFSRSPIEDPVQETSVKDTAAAEAAALGVAAAGTRAVFAAQIEAAKEVQLGWGSHWLYYGAPAGMAAPELGQLRSQLSEISKQIVAVLPRLIPLSKLPDARNRVSIAAARFLRVRYLGSAGRAAIVDSLLTLRRASNSA